MYVVYNSKLLLFSYYKAYYVYIHGMGCQLLLIATSVTIPPIATLNVGTRNPGENP